MGLIFRAGRGRKTLCAQSVFPATIDFYSTWPWGNSQWRPAPAPPTWGGRNRPYFRLGHGRKQLRARLDIFFDLAVVGGRRARVPEATGVDLFRVWRGRRGGSLQCSRPLKEPAERGGRTSEATGIDLFDLAVGRRRRDAQRNGLGDARRMSPLKGRTARCF